MFKITEVNLFYGNEKMLSVEDSFLLRTTIRVDYRVVGSLDVMIGEVKVPDDINELSKLSIPDMSPSEKCEWLARRTSDVVSRKDLLAEAFVLANAGL